MEDNYIKEKDIENKTLEYFSNTYKWTLESHPNGRNGVDISGKTQSGEDVYIEVKGTLDKNGEPFKQESNQNKIHMAYGTYQLITRVKNDDDIAILLLPYHRFFISRWDNIKFAFKKLNFKLFFMYKDGKIEEYK